MASDDQTLAEINKFVTREGECEVWGGYYRRGAPRLKLSKGRFGSRKELDVRRFVWTLCRTALLKSESVKPTCENPLCLNIDHLTTHKPCRSTRKEGPNYTTPDDEMLEKIKNYSSTDGDCQIWTATFNKFVQRPIVCKRVNGISRTLNAHRVLWRIKRGDIGSTTFLETSCSNPRCVNIEHLRIVEKPPVDWDKIWERMLTNTRKDGDCLLWTRSLSVDGYGRTTLNGKGVSAHAKSYMVKTKGAPLQSEIDGVRMQLRHTCGKRACVEPSHLVYDNAIRNAADKVTHGTTTRGARSNFSTITEETARAIKRSRREMGEEDYEGQLQRARRFKVSRGLVNKIDQGQAWSHVPDRYGNVTQNVEYSKYMREYRKEKRNKVWTKEQFESAGKMLFRKIEKCLNDAKGEVEGPCWNYTGCTKQGYGIISVHGKSMGAHILACEVQNERHRKDGEFTRHLCGNRRCCNAGHLKWGTHSENAIDSIKHGSRAVRLDADKVRDIRASALSPKELAKQYNVKYNTILSVLSRRSWSHVK